MCIIGPWDWGTGAMAQQICVVLSAAEREQLAAIAADRNRPRKHIERAQIVLASADRHPAQQVAQSIGVSRPTVWRWQQRFAESGIDGLLRDKPRKPGKAPIAAAHPKGSPFANSMKHSLEPLLGYGLSELVCIYKKRNSASNLCSFFR